MKARFLISALFAISIESALSSDSGGGLIIHKDYSFSADSSATITRYKTIASYPAVNNIVTTDGKELAILAEQTGAVLPFPQPGVSSIRALEAIANAEKRFPHFQETLTSLRKMWQRSLTVSTAPANNPTQAANTLTVAGTTYSAVSLNAVDGETATVFHSDGISKIPLTSLSPAQMIMLNSTSTIAHIEPDWAEKKRKRDLELAKQKEQEAVRMAALIVEKKRTLIEKAHQLEEAARFEEALETFTEAQAPEDVKRVAAAMATDFEKRKDYEAAAEYFEKAGLFAEAGRVRKTYNMASTVPSQRFSPEQIFARCAPATVVVVTETRRGSGQGSGFFVRKPGYILTNHHVVEGALAVHVLVNKVSYPAEVIAESNKPDLALLRIPLQEHSVLEFGDSSKVKAGASVFAIGTPKGLPTSITGGMISATDRIKFGNPVLQISVLINHGNSGGPLLDEKGKVIGITTFGEGTAAVIDGVHLGSDVQGINYAIKSNEAREILSRLSRL